MRTWLRFRLSNFDLYLSAAKIQMTFWTTIKKHIAISSRQLASSVVRCFAFLPVCVCTTFCTTKWACLGAATRIVALSATIVRMWLNTMTTRINGTMLLCEAWNGRGLISLHEELLFGDFCAEHSRFSCDFFKSSLRTTNGLYHFFSSSVLYDNSMTDFQQQ